MTEKEINPFAAFESEVKIRPDDLDLNNHVHSSKYFDYVLFARFEQMRDNYKMSMEEFNRRGLNWVASVAHIEFKRSVILSDLSVTVRTQIAEISPAQVKVLFWIFNNRTKKIASEGYGLYTLVDINSGKPTRIPDDVIAKYSLRKSDITPVNSRT